MRAAQSQAKNLVNQSGATAAGYGSNAENISSVLTPYLMRQLNSPQGISQQDQTQMLSSGLGGAGGTTAGITSMGIDRAAASGNESGFSTALDQAARERDKAAAATATGISNENTQTKLNQQNQAATGLRGLYGTDVGAQLQGLGLQNDAIKTEVSAGNNGWLQNMMNIISTLKGGGGITPQIPGGSSASQTLMNAQNPDVSSLQTTPDILGGQFDQFGNFVSA